MPLLPRNKGWLCSLKHHILQEFHNKAVDSKRLLQQHEALLLMMMMMMRDLKSVRGLAKTHQTKPSSDALL